MPTILSLNCTKKRNVQKDRAPWSAGSKGRRGTLEEAWTRVGLGAIETPQESQKHSFPDVRFTAPKGRNG
jgi:hypothetical protein